MNLSVIVPTLNGRDRLARCLDALAEHAPGVEVVVVNGPSADGTTGMVRDRADVDVLVEIADRRQTVARNAGLDRARGDVIALLNDALAVEEGWLDALTDAVADADVVTGPTHRKLRSGIATEEVEARSVDGRTVTFFNGDNAAFSREALDALDGFDEHLLTGGARDAAHRLANLEFDVAWEPGMSVRREFGTDGGRAEADRRQQYRSLAYRQAKNYGLRPSVLARIAGRAGRDAVGALREVAGGSARPSSWLGDGRDVLAGVGGGLKDGVRARWQDRSPRRNPTGCSYRADRAVAVYDWR
ncbi:MAG: glycosyltransferase family 2 protein [Haloarculaceae archaeon]